MRRLTCIALLLATGTARSQEPLVRVTPTTATPITGTALEAPIRTITRLHNSMSQPLIGTGIVIGLAGTGSSERATRSALVNMIQRDGLNVTIADVTSGAVAMVEVTATLPPFAKIGQPLDIKCGAIGDAISLFGGMLVRTELRAVTGEVYAVAGGQVMVSGYAAAGTNASIVRNHVTTGTINNGGQVVKPLESSYFSEAGDLELRLLNPSPFNAASVASGIHRALDGMGFDIAVVDPTLVRIKIPREQQTNENANTILTLIGPVRVRIENPTKVIIDQASGMVLAGEGVLISPCVVALSDLTISVVDDEMVVQPLPGINQGRTEVVGRTQIEVDQQYTEIQPLSARGATIGDLLQNLRALGLSPPQLISVFLALDYGNFLHAELEVR